MKIRVSDFGVWDRNTLKGFITVCISDDTGRREIEIPGFTLHQKDKQRWIEFPGKQDKNGTWGKTIVVNNKIAERELKKFIMQDLDRYLAELEHDDFWNK